MSAQQESMRITIIDRGQELRGRLGDRLDRVARLRCDKHGKPIVAVTIQYRENGWFDSRWTTCCDHLQQQAAAIVKERC